MSDGVYFATDLERTDFNRVRADDNLFNLHRNRYPGRGIVLGTSEDGEHMVQVYWVMGRSENSRNRVLLQDGSRVYTQIADESKLLSDKEMELSPAEQDELVAKKKELIVYNAMREDRQHRYYIVSNGVQTDDVAEGFDNGRDLFESLRGYKYEPDAPNFTPRITGYHSRPMGFDVLPVAIFSILRKSTFGDNCDRMLYQFYGTPPGFGYMVTTYMGDGNPLPSFQGDPILVPLRGDMEGVAQSFWDSLNNPNLVGMAVKFIHMKTGVSMVDVTNMYKEANT